MTSSILPPRSDLGPLLAHHPAEGVDHVGLAGAVGTDDAGDARLEVERGGRGEGLEAAQGQALEIQRPTFRPVRSRSYGREHCRRGRRLLTVAAATASSAPRTGRGVSGNSDVDRPVGLTTGPDHVPGPHLEKPSRNTVRLEPFCATRREATAGPVSRSVPHIVGRSRLDGSVGTDSLTSVDDSFLPRTAEKVQILFSRNDSGVTIAIVISWRPVEPGPEAGRVVEERRSTARRASPGASTESGCRGRRSGRGCRRRGRAGTPATSRSAGRS